MESENKIDSGEVAGSSPVPCSVPFADCDEEEVSTLNACLHLIRGGEWNEIEFEKRDGTWGECNDDDGMWPDATNFRIKEGISAQNKEL